MGPGLPGRPRPRLPSRRNPSQKDVASRRVPGLFSRAVGVHPPRGVSRGPTSVEVGPSVSEEGRPFCRLLKCNPVYKVCRSLKGPSRSRCRSVTSGRPGVKRAGDFGCRRSGTEVHSPRRYLDSTTSPSPPDPSQTKGPYWAGTRVTDSTPTVHHPLQMTKEGRRRGRSDGG